MRKTPELLDRIHALLAEGRTISQIAALPDMPSHASVRAWIMHDPRFADVYPPA